MEGSNLLRITGVLGMIGAVAIIVGTVAAILVIEDSDWVSTTMSQLAAGPHEWIQDVGIHLFALGLAAVGVGLWRLALGGWAWKLGAGLLIVLAADAVLMAAYENYSAGEQGPVIHPFAVYLLGFGFAAAPLLLAPGLRQIGPGWSWATIAIALAWIVLAPFYYVVPKAIEGAYERGLGLLVVGWMLAISLLLFEEGRARRRLRRSRPG